MMTVAVAELRMLARSPYAIVMAGLVPAALGLLMVWAERDTGKTGPGGAAGLVLVSLVAFTAYTGGTTTLAARRRQFVLKRLRTSGLPDAALLAAVLTPMFLLTCAQMAVLIGIMVAGGQPPGRPWLLMPATLAAAAVGCVLAVPTATVTSSPEWAQLTTSPIAMAFFGGGLWAVQTPAAEVSWWMSAVPGVPVARLAGAAWTDGPGVLTAFAALALVTAVVAPVGVRTFAWDPRH